MQRMTIQTPAGAALKMADAYRSESEAQADLMNRFRLAVDRLAAYEDTGLSASETLELAGKHIPQKPIKIRDNGARCTSDYRCPACGGAFTGTGIADYCYHCGQRLDWKEWLG